MCFNSEWYDFTEYTRLKISVTILCLKGSLVNSYPFNIHGIYLEHSRFFSAYSYQKVTQIFLN